MNPIKLCDILRCMNNEQSVVIYTMDDKGLGNHFAENWRCGLAKCSAFSGLTVHDISADSNGFIILRLNDYHSYITRELDIYSNEAAWNNSFKYIGECQ